MATEVMRDDARLIAAAPEMYEALRRLADWYSDGEVREIARAAIAKVETA